MTVKSVGFIGGGRVTCFLLKRLKKSAVLSEKIIIADPDQNRHCVLNKLDPEITCCTIDNKEAASCDLIVLAVHPQKVDQVFSQITGPVLSDSIILSLIPIFTIKAYNLERRKPCENQFLSAFLFACSLAFFLSAPSLRFFRSRTPVFLQNLRILMPCHSTAGRKCVSIVA